MSRHRHSDFGIADALAFSSKCFAIAFKNLFRLLEILIPALGNLISHLFHLFDSSRSTQHADGTRVTVEHERGLVRDRNTKTNDGPCWKCNGRGYRGRKKKHCPKCGGTGRYYKVVTSSRFR